MRKKDCSRFYLFILGVFLLSFTKAYSQKEASQWLFHEGGLLDFNYNSPQLSFKVPLGPPAIASICNRKGELLFYTDGKDIYDSWHAIVPGGQGLSWMVNNPGNDDGKIIIPAGISEQKYYLVTADGLGRWTTNPFGYTTECCYKNDTTITYSIINVDKDKKVSIVQKDILLLKKGINLVAATKHANGIDTWLVTAEFGSNRINAFLFTECGVMPSVVSNSDPEHGGPDNCLYLKFSPDGKNLVTHFKAPNSYLFDFDNITGMISNPIDISDCSIWKPAFSPNSNYVYSYDIPFNSNYICIKRFDVLNQTCDSLIFHKNNDLRDSILGNNMGLGIDGKIYFISDNGGSYLIGYYENADGPLSKSNLKFYVYDTTNPRYMDGIGSNFPNFISNYFDPNYVSSVQHPQISTPIRSCVGDSIPFSIDKTNLITEYHWDFGDGDTSILNTPKHVYSNPGNYSIKLMVRYSCLFDTIYQSISIDSVSTAPANEIIYGCNDAVLNAGDNYASYLWNTGETTSSITVSNEGEYKVVQTDGCGSYETKYSLIKPQTPAYNLITPNRDDKNDKLTFSDYPLSSSLQIYDRWGVLVYSNNDYKNNWDAADLSDGIYYYRFTYEGCPEVKSWVQVVR